MFFTAKCNSCDGKYDSLDVRITKACDNDCQFCIERTGIEDQGMCTPQLLIDKTIESGHKNVLILGGEPFLIPLRIQQYVEGIRDHVDTIYATTSLPSFMTVGPDLDTIEMLNGLNVSIHSTDWEENNRILRAKSNHNRLELLKELNIRFADKIRVNLTLSRGGIDSSPKLVRALVDLEAIGCKHIRISELQHESEFYVSFEEIMHISLPPAFARGCQTRITGPGELIGSSQELTLKRSCFLVEPSLKASISDLAKSIYRMFTTPNNKFNVLYEDGSLRNGWVKKGTS